MTEATLDSVVGTFQMLCIMTMVIPICYLIHYRDRAKQVQLTLRRAWRFWYTAYAAPVILLILTATTQAG
jgi:hypothetical protein